MSKQILTPDATHPITITPTAGRVTVTLDGGPSTTAQVVLRDET